VADTVNAAALCERSGEEFPSIRRRGLRTLQLAVAVLGRRSRLGRRVGTLAQTELRTVDDALKVVLGLF
jgi:hypothetical protein